MSTILNPSGQPARPSKPAASDRCPTCGAGKKDRVDTAGFGAAQPVICCQKCGHHYEGATK